MTGKSAINGLIAAAKQESEKIQSVKSVAETPNQPEKPEQEVVSAPAMPKEAQPETAQPSGEAVTLEQLLKKWEEKDNEIVRIPRSVHKELKLVSTMTGTPIGHLVANCLVAMMKQHEKEIVALKKKYIKGL